MGGGCTWSGAHRCCGFQSAYLEAVIRLVVCPRRSSLLPLELEVDVVVILVGVVAGQKKLSTVLEGVLLIALQEGVERSRCHRSAGTSVGRVRWYPRVEQQLWARRA